MHQNILSQMEMFHIIPAKNLFLWKHFLVLHFFFFVYIIGKQHIHLLFFLFKLFQNIQNLVQCFFIYPVITVHHFKIFSLCVVKTYIDRISVSTIFLINCTDDRRILFFILMCNLWSIILWSVINYDDLYIFSTF